MEVLKFSNMNINKEPLVIPVLLAGGSGSRLWPLSRKCFPKQYLNISDFASLETTTRLRRILYILCDDYEKTLSESGSLTYNVDPQIEQNLGQNQYLHY